MAITPFSGSAPTRGDRTTFSSRLDAFITWLLNLPAEFNAAIAAMNLNATTDTSTTSLAIGAGSKSLTVSANKSFVPAMTVKIGRTSDGTKWMLGEVTSYNISTGALVVNVVKIRGSGTFTDWTISLAATETYSDKIQPITASVATNALTVTLNPTALDFRSSTLSSGAVNTRDVPSAISMTVSSGSTLGTVSGQAARLALLAIDNAGTVELAIANMAGGLNLDETTLISTTAEGGAGAADSATVIYSTTARTNVAYRVIGYIESTQTTAGTWATAPSLIQGAGGNAVAALRSFGVGQTRQSVSGSRALSTTYYNTTSKAIFVEVYFTSQSTISGIVAGNAGGGVGDSISFPVPPGASYSVTSTNAFNNWVETR